MNHNILISKLNEIDVNIDKVSPFIQCGRVVSTTGMIVKVSGMPLAMGEICRIYINCQHYIDAEVIGFNAKSIIIMPYENTSGIAKGMLVTAMSFNRTAPVGDDLLGRVVDGLANPIDGLGKIEYKSYYPIFPKPLNPLMRSRIKEPLDVGVRAINSLFTICKGQRMGIFAESGMGKSVLLGMMTKFSKADVVVVGLIGERGREVKEFIEEIIGAEGLKKSVVIAASADNSPLMKVAGAAYSTSVAEYFRDKGFDVLLIIDSLTRFAQAYREITLSGGELPTSKGYTPSVFAKLSQLVERSGNSEKEKGSITAFYTVLTEGEDISDPVSEHIRSLIDGHIILSRDLADSGHYPAIDIEKSISRLMHSVVSKDISSCAQAIKRIANTYYKNRDIVNIGMYQHGSNSILDIALKYWPDIYHFLTQNINECVDMKKSIDEMFEIVDKFKVVE